MISYILPSFQLLYKLAIKCLLDQSPTMDVKFDITCQVNELTCERTLVKMSKYLSIYAEFDISSLMSNLTLISELSSTTSLSKPSLNNNFYLRVWMCILNMSKFTCVNLQKKFDILKFKAEIWISSAGKCQVGTLFACPNLHQVRWISLSQ